MLTWEKIFNSFQDNVVRYYSDWGVKTPLRCFVDLQLDFIAVKFKNPPEAAKEPLEAILHNELLCGDFMMRLIGNLVMHHTSGYHRYVRRTLTENGLELVAKDGQGKQTTMLVPYDLQKYLTTPTSFQQEIQKYLDLLKSKTSLR